MAKSNTNNNYCSLAFFSWRALFICSLPIFLFLSFSFAHSLRLSISVFLRLLGTNDC